MINLLPSDNRKQLKASVLNTSLLKYIFFFVAILIAMAASVGLIYVNLIYTKNSLNQDLEQAKQRALTIQESKTEIEAFRDQINEADKIFSEQVHYSQLLTALAASLPSDVHFTGFKISEIDFKTPQTVQVNTKNSDKIIETKQALEKTNFISSVSIASVAKDQKTGDIDGVLLLTFDQAGLKEVTKWRAK